MSIKIYIGSEIRRLNTQDIKDYSDLHKRLSTFAKNETSIYKYQDIDGDWVTFNSQEEWSEATKNHHKDGFKIKVVGENENKCPRFQHKGEERKCPRFQGCSRQKQHHGLPNLFQGEQVNQFISQLGNIGKDLFGNVTGTGNLSDLFKSPHGEQDGQVLHRHVVCDGCNVTPIKGNRYRCNELKDFDLCQVCYDKKAFPKEHTFTVISKPIGSQGFWQEFVNDIYKEAEKVNSAPTEKMEEKAEEIQIKEEAKEYVEDLEIYENIKPEEKVVEEKPQYSEQLDLLKSMGFFNTDANIVFLKKHGGNIQRVVAELLNQ